VPLIKAGFVDWIVSTGAILYRDMHFALNYPVRMGSFMMDDNSPAPKLMTPLFGGRPAKRPPSKRMARGVLPPGLHAAPQV
jgi:hypothetical protein